MQQVLRNFCFMFFT